MSETAWAAEWLYSTLTADAGVIALVGNRVYAQPAPESSSYPMIVFQHQAGTDHPVFGTGARASELSYIVRGVDRSRSRVAVSAIAEAIDLALEKAGGSVTGATILGVVRTAPFEMTEADQGIVYQHQGGTYRVWVQAS